jgi:simple sugar transport system permease protein
MSTTLQPSPDLTAGPAQRGGIIAIINRTPATRTLTAGVIVLALLSLTRVISGADDLTSSGTMSTTIRLAIPILLAGLAGLYAERVGVLNIGIEGMMILGTWFGGFGAWMYGPWIGLLLGVLGGMAGGFIHAVATVKFNVDHVISGVVMNLFAFNAMRYLSDLVFTGEEGGGISQSPAQTSAIPTFSVPFLAGGTIGGWKSPDIHGWLENRHWFFIGDLAGLLRGVFLGLSWASAIALALVPLSAWLLWRTRFGLRLRSSGEAPDAAESLGVKVTRVRYGGLLISGGMAGFSGAYLAIVPFNAYRQGQTAGRGFIGLATMIFGNWMPTGVLGGALLFGWTDALKLRKSDSITALFLFITFLAGVAVILALYRRKVVSAGVAAAAGALFLIVYLTVDEVPESLTQATPYLATLIVLATASQRLRPPAFAGRPWRSGEGH